MENQSDKTVDHHQLPKRNKIIYHQTQLPSSPIPEPAQEIPNIPDELITEILSRLPVKSLLRFRCVSKSWLSLISSPHFIKTHLIKSANSHDYNHHRLIFHTFEHCNGGFKFNFKQCPLYPALYSPTAQATNMLSSALDHSLLGNKHNINREIIVNSGIVDGYGYHHDVLILGSCNGIICVYIFGEIFLWNPSIKKSRKLPNFSPKLEGNGLMLFVYGYDEYDDDYKVFRFLRSEDVSGGNEKSWVDVYSRNADYWRRIENFEGVLSGQAVCFVRGKLHWTMGTGVEKIVSFDLRDETYGAVEQPKCEEGYFNLALEELGGCLSVLCFYENHRADVWIMREYGVKESWTKVVLVSIVNGPGHEMLHKPVFLAKDGQILLHWGNGLAIYNPNCNSITYPHITKLKALLQVIIHAESLVLLNDHGGVERPGNEM